MSGCRDFGGRMITSAINILFLAPTTHVLSTHHYTLRLPPPPLPKAPEGVCALITGLSKETDPAASTVMRTIGTTVKVIKSQSGRAVGGSSSACGRLRASPAKKKVYPPHHCSIFIDLQYPAALTPPLVELCGGGTTSSGRKQ